MNRFTPIAVALAILLLVLPASARAQTPDPLILDAFESVSDGEITVDAQILTGRMEYRGRMIQSRHVDHPDHALAFDYLVERLEGLGAEVVEEEFDCNAVDPCANLIVELPGDTNPESIWMVGAHFDSTNGYDESRLAPGAVDNASGVIILLQALAALRDYRMEDSTRFVLFDAEEIGLKGSRVHARAASDHDEDIRLMVNLDVPGFRLLGLNAAFSNSDETSWPDLQLLNQIAPIYPIGTAHIGVPAPAIDSADMASFWDMGYNAFMIGSLYALTGWMNTEKDTYEKLDLEQCANVSRLVIAYMAERAGIHEWAPPNDDDDDDEMDDDDTDEPEEDDQETVPAPGDDNAGEEGCCGT